MNLNKMEVVLLARMRAPTVDRGRAWRNSSSTGFEWRLDLGLNKEIHRFGAFKYSRMWFTCLSPVNPASGPILVSSSLSVYCLQSLAAAFMLIKCFLQFSE